MFTYLTEWSLKSRLKKQQAQSSQQFISWDQVKQVALIVDAKTAGSKQLLDNYIQQSKKHVDVYYVELGSKTPTFADWHCFTKQHKSLLNLPTEKALLGIKSEGVDLVINACDDTNYFATALASWLHPMMVCNSFETFNASSLIIKKAEPFDLIVYLNNITHYLKMIRLKQA